VSDKANRRKGDKFPSSIELRLPSRLGYEKVAMNTAASVARLMGFSEERVDDLKTAVAEACINAMEHGNKLDESLSVGVILSMDANSLEVKVTDNGEGSAEQDRTRRISTRRCMGEEDARGMGMFLIQALVDEAEWVSSTRPRAATPAWSFTSTTRTSNNRMIWSKWREHAGTSDPRQSKNCLPLAAATSLP
jgi:serine/threonine-protein kinase RsbW